MITNSFYAIWWSILGFGKENVWYLRYIHLELKVYPLVNVNIDLFDVRASFKVSGYYDTDDDYNLTVRLVSGILTTGLHILIFWFSSDSDGSDGLFWYIFICCDCLILMNNVWHLWNIQTRFILFYSHTKLWRVCAVICLISWFLVTYGLNQFSNFKLFFEKKNTMLL